MRTISHIQLKTIQTNFPKKKITNSDDSYNFIKQFYSDDIEIYESFFILLLDRANNTTGYAKISQGGVAGTIVDPKIIAKYAVDFLASGIILAHNHPSGNTVPSIQDREMTSKLKNAMKLLDIEVLDHIILTSEDYYSFADNGVCF